MPRALAIRYVTVADADRARYVARLLARVANARRVGYHLWAFAAEGGRERVVEFVEARDEGALDAALAQDRVIEISQGALPLDAPLDPRDEARLAAALGEPLAVLPDESPAPGPRWERFIGLADAS